MAPKEYPPHIPRDYKIKNSNIILIHYFDIGQKLEDLKNKTFMGILSSFEKNDFHEFEQMMRQDPEYMASRRLSLQDRKN